MTERKASDLLVEILLKVDQLVAETNRQTQIIQNQDHSLKVINQKINDLSKGMIPGKSLPRVDSIITNNGSVPPSKLENIVEATHLSPMMNLQNPPPQGEGFQRVHRGTPQNNEESNPPPPPVRQSMSMALGGNVADDIRQKTQSFLNKQRLTANPPPKEEEVVFPSIDSQEDEEVKSDKKIPVRQKIRFESGINNFLISVEIYKGSTKIMSAKTNSEGIWSGALKPGAYSLTLKKKLTDGEVNKTVKIVVPADEIIATLPDIIIK